MVGLNAKKIWANWSVWADRAKSRATCEDSTPKNDNDIGYEVDLIELAKPEPLIYEVHGEWET